MKTKYFLFVILMLAFWIAACGGNASTPAPQIDPAPTQAATLEPTVTVAVTTSTPDTISACKVRPYSFTNVGFGLPNPSYKLPSVGAVKTIVLFADFPDVPAVQTPEEALSIISPNAEKFFNDISYGKMTWTLEPHLTWLHLSQPSSHYGEAIRSYEGHLEFIQEAVSLADAAVDFSTADSVVVMVPPEATAVGYGPAFGANEGQGYTADGKIFSNGVTSGADVPAWGFLWLNHESGHTMGLPDLYSYQYDPANYNDQHRFVGGFGLMGYIDGNAPEFFAFERWQLGWLEDTQIICQLEGEQTTTITPIEMSGGVKAIMIPINDSKVIVIESRRPIGYDSSLIKSGALVYTVDTSIYSGEGTLVVYPILENDPYRDQSPLANGESITVENVTITVTDSSDDGDTVQVTIK